jgi:hypothetical protein
MKSQVGQALIEYILLLVISASLAAIVVRQIGSRNPDDAGVLVKKWVEIQKEIGKDNPDSCQGPGCLGN